MILSMICYSNMGGHEDPTIINESEVTEKRETQGFSLKLFETKKVSEMLKIPERQSKNLLQQHGEIKDPTIEK